MKTCPRCGHKLESGTEECPYCERWFQRIVSYQIFRQGNIGFAFLGFLLPFIGLILYLFIRRSAPESAALIGFGAILSSAFAIVLGLLFLIVLLL